MLKVATLHVRIPAVAELHRFILCTRRSEGTAHEGGGCDQSIGSTVSDAIVRSWLWSTATTSSPLGQFSNYYKQLIIDPTFCGSRFSTGGLLVIEDFTFLPFPPPIFHSIHPGQCRHDRRLTCKWVIVRTILSSTGSWFLSDGTFRISVAFHFRIRPAQSIRDSLVAKMQIINM